MMQLHQKHLELIDLYVTFIRIVYSVLIMCRFISWDFFLLHFCPFFLYTRQVLLHFRKTSPTFAVTWCKLRTVSPMYLVYRVIACTCTVYGDIVEHGYTLLEHDLLFLSSLPSLLQTLPSVYEVN
jgi:hypothetical protein